VPRSNEALPNVRGVIGSAGKFPTADPADEKVVAFWTRIGSSLAEAAK
jgi:hypothetical protein